MDLEYPTRLEEASWRREVGGLDTLKIGPMLKKLEDGFGDLPMHLYGTEGLTAIDEAKDRFDQALGTGAKAAKAFAGDARAVGAAIRKLVAEHKKNKKAAKPVSCAAVAAEAADKLSNEIVALSASSALAIKSLIAKMEDDQKRAAEKKAAGDGPDPKLLAHNSKVRSMLNKLRGGKQPRTPFAFLQCKVRKPYEKSKPWEKKSLMHIGPKALKSCRSELEKLLADQRGGDFVFFFGEVELEGAKGKGKLVFEFESPLANPKQMKDALLFQCRYSPPFQVRKLGSAEVIEEAAEGDENDAEGDDDDDDAKPAGWVAARPSAVQDAEISQARTALVGAQGDLRKGIATLMERVTSAYRGVTGSDLESVKGALRKLDALRQKLDIDVDAPLAEIAKGKDAADRAKRLKAALDRVGELGAVVAADDLITDLDGNELMPGMVVVAPMKDAIKKAIGALR